MDVTVFYAWQSDSPNDQNWKLIQNAARDACARITADKTNDWNVTLDHDTQGVPGMCDIPREILTKIRKCDIFLADLTLVGETPGKKRLPNSNVVFELGYAARKLGFGSLVGVVNEAFGKIDGQVFDIKRRSCLRYNTSKKNTPEKLEKEIATLSKSLEEVFRGTIEKVVLPKCGATISEEAKSAGEIHTAFAKRVLDGDFYDIKQSAVVTSVFFGSQAHLKYEKLGEAVRDLFSANPLVDADDYAWDSNGAVTEFSLSGYLHRVCRRDYKTAINLRQQMDLSGIEKVRGLQLHAQTLHRNIVSGVLDAARLLNRLQIKTPWHIAISLVGFHGFPVMDDANKASPHTIRKDILNLPILRLTKIERMTDSMEAGTFLRPAMEALTRSVGWEYNWFFTQDGRFTLRVT